MSQSEFTAGFFNVQENARALAAIVSGIASDEKKMARHFLANHQMR